MNCNSITLSNIAKDCEGVLGGIKKVWLTIWKDNLFVTSAATEGTKVTGVDTGATWYEYSFRKNTGSYESTQTVSDAGNNFFTNTLTMVFSRMETVKRTAVQALSIGEVGGIVLDCNGKFWAFGQDEAGFTTGNSGATGTAKADTNAYTVVLASESFELPYEVDPSVMENLNIGD